MTADLALTATLCSNSVSHTALSLSSSSNNAGTLASTFSTAVSSRISHEMANLGHSISKPAVWVLTPLATLLVGWLDYYAGAEVRVLALYFLPLLFAGWHLGKIGAVFSAIFATVVWVIALYCDGVRFSGIHVWIINVLTEGLGFIVVSLLVAKLRETVNRERSLSHEDHLTGLANRRSFFELGAFGLAISRRHEHPVSLAYIDLDNFKNVNDTHGHKKGDDLLRQCANLIAGCVRTSDTVARLGGDEFAVFMPETDSESAEHLLERIRHTVESARDFSYFAVTLSIGVVSENPVRSDLNVLLSKADAQMFKDKQQRVKAANLKRMQSA